MENSIDILQPIPEDVEAELERFWMKKILINYQLKIM